ncbi:MAG: hypothetical protein CMA96_02850 [Euryarchaeota archaeon]|nr:hypothetical protein [Euryarchaeota archaeon]
MAPPKKPFHKLGATARYLRLNPDSAKKKRDYDTAYHATSARKKYRADLDRERRARKRAGQNLTGKDVSHTKGGGTTLEDSSKNRARNRGKK